MTNEVNREDIAADLLMALLAVNSWTLDRVGRLYPLLRQQELFDVASLGFLDVDQIRARLFSAGYDRGDVLGEIMALRVKRVAIALAAGVADALADLEKTRDAVATRKLLLSLNGVGPAVVENYLILRASGT